jgi:deferrochelatase/peroxidase EfeB
MNPSPQQGILNRPPDHVLFVAVDCLANDPAEVRVAVEGLQQLTHHELRSQLDPMDATSDKTQVGPETGELGFESGYDRYHLTITVGFGATAYDKLAIAADQRPADLRPIPWADLGDVPLQPNQGDLLLQVCSDSLYVAEHVVRRIEEELSTSFQVLWVLPGSQRHTSRSGRVSHGEGRALIGFKDGSSNLDPKHAPEDRRLVFVDPADRTDLPPQTPPVDPAQPNPYAPASPVPTFPPLHELPGVEPDWTKEGTYMVLRASVIDMNTWDHQTLDVQEHTVGRFKVTGNPLGTNPDVAPTPPASTPDPDFTSDLAGQVTPFNAHIRKVNPRGPNDSLRRIFRRGYPLILPTTDGIKLGLSFVCFARTITTQFEFITRAWTTNENFPLPGAGHDRLRDVETVLGGGYYFVPPLAHPGQPWSWVVPVFDPTAML